jgi:hypothetical protein
MGRGVPARERNPVPKVYVTGSVTAPAPVLHEYVAGLNGARLSILAGSLLAAKQIAVATWKPLKKDAGYLWVRNCADTSTDF